MKVNSDILAVVKISQWVIVTFSQRLYVQQKQSVQNISITATLNQAMEYSKLFIL